MPKKDLAPERCEEILRQAEFGYLGMCREGEPYCIPFNFLYDKGRIYIHTGHKGTKWDYITANPRVCFTVSVPGRKKTGESPCQYTFEFESVTVFGWASKVVSEEETAESLGRLIDKYREGPVGAVPGDKLAKLCMIRIDIEKITGRQNL
ncbi:pyridoxamine 5'-phosphate oxidase family protein [Thermincola potens]|uniref:Pyridoxamine 5'-phosphate oxidase-related FMN-binding protein n=2 Tax=Thermincola TaxID=278993 RepID=D5XAD6_THEPJ|nr:pyridoxamine 5'-phosphate oxidase family protein [Thermincola potens]ADG81235.1 pyridoxamine 5'-phosphate oxidase-related FMN-binding protein [Thermincola potens JR]